MAAEFICPHCESTIPDSDERAETLTACPYCNAALSPSSLAASARPAPAPPVAPPSPIRFSLNCERCGSILEANSSHAGRAARCPTCGATFVVPSPDPRTGLPVGRAVATNDGLPPHPMHAYAAAGARAPRIEKSDDGADLIVCPRCDARNPIEADLCSACGTPFTIDGAGGRNGFKERISSSALLSLTCGLLACLPIGPLAILFGGYALFRTRRIPRQTRTRFVACVGVCLGIASSLAWLAYLT